MTNSTTKAFVVYASVLASFQSLLSLLFPSDLLCWYNIKHEMTLDKNSPDIPPRTPPPKPRLAVQNRVIAISMINGNSLPILNIAMNGMIYHALLWHLVRNQLNSMYQNHTASTI